MQLIDNIPVWGSPDEGAMSQIKTCALTADRVATKNGVVTRVGKVSKEMMAEWVASANVELRGAGVDESPHCYKRLPEVLAEHGDSIKILHTLTPIGVAMAGEREFDPYKD
jgi:tRNA-splicing ligase RtcB (3'-phosphate/5'-hydroxy nucleic acid ligase)